MNTEKNFQTPKEVHHGRNVKRLREMLGIKQDVLADIMALSQQTISRFEAQEVLDDNELNKLANALNVPVEAIKNFDEMTAVNIIANTFNEQAIAYQYNFHPISKIIQLYEEKFELYERFLKAEQEKNALLEKLLKDIQK